MDHVHPCPACSSVGAHAAGCPRAAIRAIQHDTARAAEDTAHGLREHAGATIVWPQVDDDAPPVTCDSGAVCEGEVSLALDVWRAVHGDVQGMPPLDTPRDRAELLAAVRALREDREACSTALVLAHSRIEYWLACLAELHEHRRKAEADAREARAERDALREIVEGRATPPKDRG